MPGEKKSAPHTKLFRDVGDLETSDEKKEIAVFALKEREKIDSQTCESARVARLLHPSTRTSARDRGMCMEHAVYY